MCEEDQLGPRNLTGILLAEEVSYLMGTKNKGEFLVTYATVTKLANLKRHVEVPRGRKLDDQAFKNFVNAVKAGGDISVEVSAILKKSYANDIGRAQAILAVAVSHGHNLVRDETTEKGKARSLEGLNFEEKEQYVIDNIPIGSQAGEVLGKIADMIGWQAIKIREMKDRDGDQRGGRQYYSLLVGSHGPPSLTVIHMIQGRPILINPDRQSQLQQSWTKETTKEKFAAYFSEVSESNSTSSSISSVSGTGSGEEGDGFGNELTLEEGLQSGGEASMGRARNWGTLAGAAGQGCVAIPATSNLPVPVSPPSSKGSGPDGPRPLKPSAKTGLEKLVEDLAVKVETLGERLATTRNELQGQIEQQCLRTQAQIEQQGKQTDERFERIFGLFSVQIAAFTKGRAPPSSTPEPGETAEAVTDDSSGGVHGSQYGPAVVARKKVQFGPYVEDDDEK